MKKLMCCALLACLPGCIPIGIRGTSITAVDSPWCGSPREIAGPLPTRATPATKSDLPGQAPPRCA